MRPVFHQFRLAVILALTTLVFGAVPASAQTDTDQVLESKSAVIAVELSPSGQVRVTEQHTWILSSQKTPTVVRQLPLFSSHGDEQIKKFEYSDFSVTSDTDHFDTRILDSGSELEVQMTRVPPIDSENQAGEEDGDFLTLQAVLEYSVQGIIYALPGSPEEPGTHEFSWTVFDQPKMNYDNIEIRVAGPTRALTAACDLVAADSDEPQPEPAAQCVLLTEESNNDVEFEATSIPLLSTLSVQASYPFGTFARTTPLTIDWQEPLGEGDQDDGPPVPFDPTWTENLDPQMGKTGTKFLPIAGVAALVIGSAVTFGLTRRRSDYRFIDSAPGAIPSSPETHSLERATLSVTAARTTTIPLQVSVAEAGAVAFAELRAREVSATLIDLAARGHLTLTTLDAGGAPVWLMTKVQAPPDQTSLLGHEEILLSALFAQGDQVEITSMHANFAPASLDVLRTLGQEVANKALFRQLLEHEATNHGHRKQRSGLGRALLEQLTGFTDFLTHPTDSELEALVAQSSLVDVFSRYLPYAITLGCGSEWARACDQYGSKFTPPSWFTSEKNSHSSSYEEVVDQLMVLVRTSF